MKKILFLIGILATTTLQARQSSYLYFADKNGLMDSLEVAIDLTDEERASIPEWSYDETVNAIQDSVHWVWLWSSGVTVYYGGDWGSMTFSRTYPYKPYGGHIEGGKRYLYLPADRLPVTITWNKQFYIDNNLQGSVLSDMICWFDAGCDDDDLPQEILSSTDSCVVHYTYMEGDLWCTYSDWDGLIVKQIGLSIGTLDNLSQGVGSVNSEDSSATKIFHNGQILIQRGDKVYTLQGQEVK